MMRGLLETKMPRQMLSAVRQVLDEDAMNLPIHLVAELAEPLAEFMVADYEREDWQDSPLVETLARVAALLEARAQDIPPAILEALRKASEAGQPVGVA
jgi:hypothetical protein